MDSNLRAANSESRSGASKGRSTERNARAVVLCLMAISVAIWITSYAALVWFDGMNGHAAVDALPGAEQYEAALPATLCTGLSVLGWCWPLLTYANFRGRVAFFQSTLVVLVMLVAYGGAAHLGFGGVGRLPSIFKSEEQWLPFVLKVAPIIALVSGLLTVAGGRWIFGPHEDGEALAARV